MLRFYFKIDPEELSDKEFEERSQELFYVLDLEGKRLTGHGKINLL